jgi:hypothetical protein
MTLPSELDFMLETLDDLSLGSEATVDLSRLIIENLAPLSQLERSVILLSNEARSHPEIQPMLERIWEGFNEADLREQARRRLLVGLIGPGEPLDSHIGGYLATFALAAGMEPRSLTRLVQEFLTASNMGNRPRGDGNK